MLFSAIFGVVGHTNHAIFSSSHLFIFSSSPLTQPPHREYTTQRLSSSVMANFFGCAPLVQKPGRTGDLDKNAANPSAALRYREQEQVCEFITAFSAKHSDLHTTTENFDAEFKKLRSIGTGASGTVWKVQDREGRRFALKEIDKPETGRTRENCVKWKALLTEIEVLTEISYDKNPLCVQLFGLRNSPTHIGLVLELVKGTNLQRFGAVNPMSERDASEISSHILRALKYLHEEKKIVHRDIKPENILIYKRDTPIRCDKYVVKLVDFGSSRFIKEGLLGGRYGEGELLSYCGIDQPDTRPAATPVGSALYLALETINISLNMEDLPTVIIDQLPKVDVFSLGVVAYVLICRSHPFMGTVVDNVHDMKEKMIDSDGLTKLYFPDEDDHPLSPDVKSFLHAVLELCPKKRLSARQALEHPWIVSRASCCEAVKTCTAENWEEICKDIVCQAPEERPEVAVV